MKTETNSGERPEVTVGELQRLRDLVRWYIAEARRITR